MSPPATRGARGGQARAGREAARRDASRSASALRDDGRRERAACCRSARCAASTPASRSRATSSATRSASCSALKAWYCDSAYRYAMTDDLQPLPLRASTRAAGGRPEGRPAALLHARPRQPSGRHRALPRRRDRRGAGAARREFGALLLVRRASSSPTARIGHLDLTMAVRMDWHEGFQVYGEHGSVVGQDASSRGTCAPSEVECFSAQDGQYHRPLGADAPLLPPPGRGLRRHDPHGAPQRRRRRRRRARRDARHGRDRALGRDGRDRARRRRERVAA